MGLEDFDRDPGFLGLNSCASRRRDATCCVSTLTIALFRQSMVRPDFLCFIRCHPLIQE